MTVELPCILLSYQSSVYASFAPLPLLNGSTSNPKDVFFIDSVNLFDGPIEDFIFLVQKNLNIESDIIVQFQDMCLELHSDSYMTGQLSLAEIHTVYKELRLVQNYSQDKIPPLKLKILELSSCFRKQLAMLKETNLNALKSKKVNPYIDKGDLENPISIEDDITSTHVVNDDEVIIIDDEECNSNTKENSCISKKIARPFLKVSKKGIKFSKMDIRGSSQIFRFCAFNRSI